MTETDVLVLEIMSQFLTSINNYFVFTNMIFLFIIVSFQYL